MNPELAQHEDNFKHLLNLSENGRLSLAQNVKSEGEADPLHVLLTEKDREMVRTEDSVHPFLSVNMPGTNLDTPAR